MFMQLQNVTSIALYGYGYVGKAFAEFAGKHANITMYDPAYMKRKPEAELAACDAAVICVPTPPTQNGACDTSLVESIVKEIPHNVVLIKSTISPGTTERLVRETGKHIVYSPEYISESTYANPYYKTMADTPFVIVGGRPQARTFWIEFLQNILGPTAQYFQCTSTEAELVKYTANAYSALKITFVNELYEIARAVGADWHTVRAGWLLDRRVEPMSTMVFPQKRGYTGKCLPKDMLALITVSQQYGYRPRLLQSVHDANLRFAAERLGTFLQVAYTASHPEPDQSLAIYQS